MNDDLLDTAAELMLAFSIAVPIYFLLVVWVLTCLGR